MPGRPRTFLLACALAAFLGGCGSNDDATIPSAEGEDLVRTLDGIESSLASNNCELIDDQVQSFVEQVNALPEDVDPEVRKGLTQGAANLLALSEDPDQCGEVTGATDTGGAEPETPTTTETEEPTTTSSTTTSTTTTSTTTEPDEEEPPPDQDEGDEGGGPPLEVPGGEGGEGSGGRGGATDSGGLEGGKRSLP
jgi:hypothetical protein